MNPYLRCSRTEFLDRSINFSFLGKVPVLDDIKKMEDEIERYKKMASFYEQKTQIMEQQYNQLFSEGLLAVEVRQNILIISYYSIN